MIYNSIPRSEEENLKVWTSRLAQGNN